MKKKNEPKKKGGLRFDGVFTALVTPFKKGKVDFVSLKRLVRQQMDGGVQGFVVNGTTAESPTLETAEVKKIFRLVRKESDGAVPLILGIGSNSTAKTVKNAAVAKKLKADAALVVVPYYNKPPQRAMQAHFQEVAKKCKVPVVLYNVPGRTVVSMSAETILALSNVRNIVGVKEASGDMATIELLARQAPKDFLLSSGDDGSAIQFLLRGGHGVISVISHIIPKEFVELTKMAREKQAYVRTAYGKFDHLNKLLSLEANPIPVKMMLHLMGVIDSPELRLPLLALEGENKEIIRKELMKLGLI